MCREDTGERSLDGARAPCRGERSAHCRLRPSAACKRRFGAAEGERDDCPDQSRALTDAGAIALALAAVRLAQRPPSGRFTFGLKRSEILSAQLNGATLLVLTGVIGFEAATSGRRRTPDRLVLDQRAALCLRDS